MKDYIKIAKKWTKQPYDEHTRISVQKLLDDKNYSEIEDRFYKNLEFGTGGMRGKMGVGTNRVNIYTVSTVTQGVANYLLNDTETPSVVIAHDSRNNSRAFAVHAAEIFAGNGIKTYFFDDFRPTPLLSFAIRFLSATAGINITASHNPKEYNGYKVFYRDGAQVLPPHDNGIIQEIKKIQSFDQVEQLTFDKAKNDEIILDVPEKVEEEFFKAIEQNSINPDLIKTQGHNLKIVYTPIHGAGIKAVPHILNRIGFNNVIKVEEQFSPDGNFPTVEVPNPEEQQAFKLALELAKKENADIAIATDPDCDRMGVCVEHDDEYVLLNGNEIGIILEYYMLSGLKEQNKLPENGLIISTIVSTPLSEEIAKYFNLDFKETLTGFKYIGHEIETNPDKKFIMGFEESYGYLTCDFIRDKCGVSAAAMISEVAVACKYLNKTLIDYLEEIYNKFGFRKSYLKSFRLEGIEGQEKIKSVLTELRKNSPKSISGIKVIKVRDILKSEIKVNGKVTEKISLPISNVLTFYLEDGTIITARPSGTEPKIKFYISIKPNSDNVFEGKILADKLAEQITVEISGWLNE